MSAIEEKTSPRAVWWLLATVLLVELMDLLDSTIVTVAERSLGTSPVGPQCVNGGYALTSAPASCSAGGMVTATDAVR